jgi:hypothetical protein
MVKANAIPKWETVCDDSKRMRKAFELSIEEIESVLQRKRAITDVTRVAANTLSNYSRVKSTEIHDKALELMVARKDIKQIQTDN